MKIAIVGANVEIKLINRFEYCMRLSDTLYLKLPFLIQNNLQTHLLIVEGDVRFKQDSSHTQANKQSSEIAHSSLITTC